MGFGGWRSHVFRSEEATLMKDPVSACHSCCGKVSQRAFPSSDHHFSFSFPTKPNFSNLEKLAFLRTVSGILNTSNSKGGENSSFSGLCIPWRFVSFFLLVLEIECILDNAPSVLEATSFYSKEQLLGVDRTICFKLFGSILCLVNVVIKYSAILKYHAYT